VRLEGSGDAALVLAGRPNRVSTTEQYGHDAMVRHPLNDIHMTGEQAEHASRVSSKHCLS